MKISALLGTAGQLAALVAAGPVDSIKTTANKYDHFLIYGGRVKPASTGIEVAAWASYPSAPDCAMFNQLPWYYERTEVRTEQGYACDGDGCLYKKQSPDLIDRLELNMHIDWNGGHYTYYKNRDHHLVDLADKVVGTCGRAPLNTLSCKSSGAFGLHNDVTEVKISAYFRCNTTVW